MAIGDLAAAAGLDVWTSAQDLNLGYQNDNQRGDDIALVMSRTSLLELGAAVSVTVFGTNWSAVTGFPPYCIKVGPMVYLFGAVKLSGSGSYSDMFTIPTAMQPPTGGARFIGNAINSSGVGFELVLTSGVVAVPAGYDIGSPGAGANVPLHCFWFMN